MSWQTYVDSNLVGTGKIVRAAILGATTGALWAKSAGYNIKATERGTEADAADEAKAIVEAFKSADKALASGVRLAGQKFFVVQANDRSVYGKKQADGCVLVKTKQAILVAEYSAPMQAGEVTPIVEGLADYLISVGY